MPTLRELDAWLLAYELESEESRFASGRANRRDMFRHVDSLGAAHGISFLCPKSFEANHGPVGTHRCQVFFSGSPVPAHLGKNKSGQLVRWNVSGTGLDDLSLTPSIQEEDDICRWHGFVGSNGVPPGSAA